MRNAEGGQAEDPERSDGKRGEAQGRTVPGECRDPSRLCLGGREESAPVRGSHHIHHQENTERRSQTGRWTWGCDDPCREKTRVMDRGDAESQKSRL